MTDTDKELVSRLRKAEVWEKLITARTSPHADHETELGIEAADLIEHLSAEVERLKGALTNVVKAWDDEGDGDYCIQIARAALQTGGQSERVGGLRVQWCCPPRLSRSGSCGREPSPGSLKLWQVSGARMYRHTQEDQHE